MNRKSGEPLLDPVPCPDALTGSRRDIVNFRHIFYDLAFADRCLRA
jgi:hypothetical protein